MARLGNQKTRERKRNAEHPKPDKAKVRVRSQDLAALLRLAETATQSLDTEKIINDTLGESLAFLGFEVGFVRTFEPGKGGMVVRAARGLRSPEFLDSVTPIDSARRNVSRIVFET